MMAHLGTTILVPSTSKPVPLGSNRRRPIALFIALAASVANGSCGTSESQSTTVTHCNVDADCATGKVCKATQTPAPHAQIAMPCPLTGCSASASCSTSQVCTPLAGVPNISVPSICTMLGSPASICAVPCQTGGCSSGFACQSDGTCRLLTCAEPGGTACPDYWKCDPTRAATEPTTIQGSATSDGYAPIKYGCVRKRCNESGGFVCRDAWACDPSTATDASGCVPVPCTISGHCSDDSLLICKPTSTKPRPSGTDLQGCVRRNCEEGLTCTAFVGSVDVGYCDFNGPMVYDDGCASKRCLDSGGVCNTGYTCEQPSSATDARGCRAPKCYSSECPSGRYCSPTLPGADADGCVASSTTGGASNAGGSSNTGGATATGGLSAAAGAPTGGNRANSTGGNTMSGHSSTGVGGGTAGDTSTRVNTTGGSGFVAIGSGGASSVNTVGTAGSSNSSRAGSSASTTTSTSTVAGNGVGGAAATGPGVCVDP